MERRLGDAARRGIVQPGIRHDHARGDGLEVRRALDGRRQLRDSRPGPVGHSDPAIGPGLGGDEFDGVAAILTIGRADEIEHALGTPCAPGVDPDDGVAVLQESPVQAGRHGGVAVQIGRPADAAGVIATVVQDYRKRAGPLGEKHAVAQADPVAGGQIARDPPLPERRWRRGAGRHGGRCMGAGRQRVSAKGCRGGDGEYGKGSIHRFSGGRLPCQAGVRSARMRVDS